MPTNAIGRGTKTIGINMPLADAVDIERKAAAMHISTGQYVKYILRAWKKSGKKVVIKEV